MSGISYDNPMRLSYSLGSYDFGTLAAGTEATAIPVPLIQGKVQATRCRIESIAAMATEVFTTGALIEIGTSADPDKFADFAFGTLADTNGLEVTAAQLLDNGYGGSGIVDVSSSGENISQLELVLTGSGAMGTGIAFVSIGIAWW